MLAEMFLVAAQLVAGSSGDAPRPNVLVLLADDLGYGDLGCYGSSVIQTPNLDRLAAEGMRLTRAYAPAPICSASRAGILTGRIPDRTGVHDWIPPHAGHDFMHLPAGELTIARHLQNAGYSTSIVGKWHLTGRLGGGEQPGPEEHGFDHHFVTPANLANMLDPGEFLSQGVPVSTEGYACDVVADEAIRWLTEDRPRDQPFFQCVWFHEPHEPLSAPADLLELYSEAPGTKPIYYAAVSNLDRAVGRILASLDELSLSEDTVVVFLSDNGPARLSTSGYRSRSHGSAGELRGFKWSLWEGGIRVPAILRWPGHIAAGMQSDVAVSGVDLFPTICTLAEAPPPVDLRLDGVDVSPLWTDSVLEREQPLYWHYLAPEEGPRAVLQDGDLVMVADWMEPGPRMGRVTRESCTQLKSSQLVDFEVYDLAADPSQATPIEVEPATAERMKRELSALHAETVADAPDWTPKESPAPRPHIILLMADDLGFGDTGFTGHPQLLTPHLDRLCAEGVRFDRFYSAAPVCSPTRASVLTGRHPFRVGIPWAFAGGLPYREQTIGERFAQAGYSTGHFGKWHVGQLSPKVKQGYAPDPVDPGLYSPPWENGFETCFSIINTVPTFNPYYMVGGEFGSAEYRMVMDRPVALDQQEGGFVWRDRFWTGPGEMDETWRVGPVPDLLVAQALTQIRDAQEAGEQALSLVWFSTPHTPVVAGPEHRARNPEASLEQQHWLGAISAMDDAVGRLVAGLEELGVADDTLIVFCSDNGPTWVHELGSTGGLRERKGSLHEGGIRVPAFAYWPAGLPSGTSCATPMVTSDLLPTACAASGIDLGDGDATLDGEDLMDVWRGERIGRSRPIGFLSPRLASAAQDTTAWMNTEGLQMAWVDGDEKLISTDGGTTWQLYNLESDPAESDDLADRRPERVKEMRTSFDAWRAEVDAEVQAKKPIAVLTAKKTVVDGVDTSPDCYAQFREQAVVVTKSGRIVLTAQGREKSKWSDRSGQDLVSTFSDDGGASWSQPVLVAAFGNHSVCPNASVYDRETDTVHVLYNVFVWDFLDPESRKSMDGRQCRQFHQQSDDGGLSWSEPREITAMLGSEQGVTVFGSGEGIQLQHGDHAGRLVVPGGFQGKWGNRMFYSDDHGVQWTVGSIAPRDGVAKLNVRLENKVAELADGTLVMNARHTPQRVRAFSQDGGVTWSTQEIDPALDAVSCNGAILAARTADGTEVLLCSVPVGPKRTHGAVYLSRDGGRTWPERIDVVDSDFAYSSLVDLGGGEIRLFYEARGHRDILMVRVPIPSAR